MPRQNRVLNGSRLHMVNLGRDIAVTSNPERTLRLSQSGLLFCTSVSDFATQVFLLGLHSQQIFVFSNNVFYFVGFRNVF